jgi:hypothetical protein
MADAAQPTQPSIGWRFSRAQDALELWDQAVPRESARTIRIAGKFVRQMTGGIAIDELSQEKREYVIRLIFKKPRSYGGEVVQKGE